jgi:hypothetical protein
LLSTRSRVAVSQLQVVDAIQIAMPQPLTCVCRKCSTFWERYRRRNAK